MIDSIRPLKNLARSTAARMWLVSLCAFLVILQSALGDSFSSLLVAFCAVAAAVLTEFLILRKRERAIAIKDGSAVVTALILTLLLPNQISPFHAVIGSVFAIAVVKHSFGGLGSNWLNPAAGGWLFIRFSWPDSFNRALETSPLSLLAESVSRGVSNFEGSPLEILKTDTADLFAVVSPLAGRISSFLNSTIFSFSGVELPGEYLDLLGSRFPGIIADRGVLALLVGTIIILASQVNRFWIPVVFLAFFGFFVRYAGALPYGGGLWNGDILFALSSGGTLVAAFFLVADPATGPKSNRGLFLTAAAAGVIAFVFRYFGSEPYGAVFAVIFVNALTPLIRLFESRKLYEKQGKTWISEIALMFPFNLFTGKKLSGGKNE